MSKRTRNKHSNKKEHSDLQRLKEENSKLKRQLATLRRQVKRNDTENYTNLKELVSQQYQESLRTQKAQDLRNRWGCHKCGQGILKLVITATPTKQRYFRKCDNPKCNKRTKLQDYTTDVEGVE